MLVCSFMQARLLPVQTQEPTDRRLSGSSPISFMDINPVSMDGRKQSAIAGSLKL